MHPYYEKKRKKLMKELERYLAPAAADLERAAGKAYPSLLQEIRECYEKSFLENFPYIGGDGASGTKNLTGAYAFVAMGEVVRRYGVSLEQWGEITTRAYAQVFAKIPGFVKKLAAKLLQHPKLVIRLLRRKDAANAANAAKNPGSFVTEVQEPTAEYPVIYHTKVCPLAGFAQKYGYEAYMPYLCNLDYVMFGALAVPFYREKTCASGDGCCDFKIKPGAPVVPAWPCHAADPEDPLK